MAHSASMAADGRQALVAGLGGGGARLHGALDLGGDVLDGDQDAHAHAGHGEFLGRRLGVEAVADVIVLGRAQPLERAERHVVVGEDEAVLRDEGGARAGVHGGEPEVVEELGGGLEAVALLEELEGRVVVGPHPFVGAGGGAREQEGKQAGEQGEAGHFGRAVHGVPSSTGRPVGRAKGAIILPGRTVRRLGKGPAAAVLRRAARCISGGGSGVPPRLSRSHNRLEENDGHG